MGIADEIDRVLRGVRALGNDVEPPRGAESAPSENGAGRPPDASAEPPPADVHAPGTDEGTGPESPDEAARTGAVGPVEDDKLERDDDAPTDPPPERLAATIVADLHARDENEQALRRLETAAFVSESLGLGYHLGGAIERIAAGASGGSGGVNALREATWLIERYIAIVEGRPLGADLHACTVRLGRAGELIAELRALSASLDAPPEEAPVAAAPVREPVAEPVGEPVPRPESEPEPVAAPVHAEAAPEAPSPAGPAVPPAGEPLWREIVLIAARWAIMVAAVALAVLAVTLIGQWR
jgi:hypothetical protein